MGLLALLMLAVGVSSASAGTASDRPLLFTFNGSDTSAGAFAQSTAIDIDQSTGAVYVVDAGRNVIDKFDLAGVAQTFSSTGSSSLSPGLDFDSLSDVAVDNSAANPGRIYAMPERGPLKAFDSAGQSLWTIGGFADVCGLAVDVAGHPWVGDYTNSLAREYATSGSPPTQIGSISTGSDKPCRLDFDASGNAYLNRFGGGVDKYEGGVKVSTLDSGPDNGVAIDQTSASSHIFTLHNDSFNEYDSSGALVGSFGTGIIGGPGGIAYDHATDRVYVSDINANTVEVFGPAVSGTVPDVTIEPTAEVGVNKATFHGTVNPQSVPNSYHFEWKQGTGSSWGSAQSSPPVSLPEDSSAHVVSFTATSLGGGRQYQVRLVGVNTENNLRAVSGADTFTTQVASAPPSISIDDVSAVTTTTAQVSGTINTHEDLTEWRVQLSTDPVCAGGFQNLATNTIPGGHAGSDSVSQELNNLLPNEHYCVRIVATNSAGSTTSEVKEFETLEALPSQVFAAYAAPRTDTTARLNAYVNPQGSDATYRFEYSEDGSDWTVLPDMQTESSVRKQITVAEEVSGLQPDTIYRYRFVVENEAGSEQSEEKTFRTRTTSEMVLPKRGIELVNQPDKGNQNLALFSLSEPFSQQSWVTPDGDKTIWDVHAGVPGGNNGSGAVFLAQRTPDGWVSKSLIPQPAEQIGNSQYRYQTNGMTPDFKHFIFRAALPAYEAEGEPTLVRLDSEQHQEVLGSFHTLSNAQDLYADTDMTDDGAHVLFVSLDTGQLEELGPSPEVLSIMPDGLPAECELISGYSFYGENVDLHVGGGAALANWQPGYHRMAMTDASRVYFEAVPNGTPCSSNEGARVQAMAIYYRNRNAGQTTEIAPPGSNLIRATRDGRSVAFVTSAVLSGEDSNSSADIYRWDVDTDHYTCLTCVVADANVVRFEIRMSEDLSHVYFISESQLVPGHGTVGAGGFGGTHSYLYALHGGQLNFVADLGNQGGIGREGELSADGNVFVFSPNGSGATELTADHTAGHECPEPGGSVKNQPCRELYRYEDATSSLECLSCRPGGVTDHPLGSAGVGLFDALSADSSTVAFVTAEKLLPEDVNGVEDIYQWRNGALSLISDGETVYPTGGTTTAPKVYSIDASGENIFFTLVDPGLTGYEQDGLANLYDARIGGGFPRPTEPVHCVEESCQGQVAGPPAPPGSSSAAFSGQGNLPTAHKKTRCASKRGKAKRRCLARRKRHVRHKHKHHKAAHRRAKHNAGGAK